MLEDQIHRTWLTSERFIPRRFIRPAFRFTKIEASSGGVLLLAALVALIWANAPFGESYAHFWETHVTLEIGPVHFDESLKHIVNDGLMAIFFFVVGLEIKRELVVGELRDPKAAALPAFAALGGMILPALIYLFIVGETAGASRGWGVPMATDIAFSIGVVALLGKRVPLGAKLFLLALAIADDIGAITVIALFYTDDLSFFWLALGALGLAGVLIAQRAGIRSVFFYVVMGFFIWFFFLESGVHATIAGVLLGLLTPARPLYSAEEYDHKARMILDIYPTASTSRASREKVDHEAILLSTVAREAVAPLTRLEDRLHIWSSYLIIPIFALANAGVRFAGIEAGDALLHPVALGVAFGLVFGKVFGVSLFTWLAVRLGLGRLPSNTTWNHVLGLAALAGIGFTVALFVGELAFTDPDLGDRAKIGIFAGSLLAGLIGYGWLRFAPAMAHRRVEELETVPAE